MLCKIAQVRTTINARTVYLNSLPLLPHVNISLRFFIVLVCVAGSTASEPTLSGTKFRPEHDLRVPPASPTLVPDMFSNVLSRGKPTASGIFEERGIASYRSRLQQGLFTSQYCVPVRTRQESLDRAQTLLRKGNNHEWVRPALDLTTHTLFCTDWSSVEPQARRLLHITDFDHWSQLDTALSEEFSGDTAELKLLLITGSLAETEVIVSRQVDDLIGPNRAIRDVEAWVRSNGAKKPRGFDIDSIKNLEAQYNSTGGTPMHELVERGLSNVIDLHSHDAVCREYDRIFVERRPEPSSAMQGVAIFALSYKHQGENLRMSKENFLQVCFALKKRKFEKVQLWIDAVLKSSPDSWSRRGLLPYTVLPIVIHNNEFYDRGRDRIWLKLERVASSHRAGVFYTRPTQHHHVPVTDHVNGDARDWVAACILSQDYDPQSVTYSSDETDLREWAVEHFCSATFRSFLGISKLGSGGFLEEAKQELLYSAVLRYNEVMPYRDVTYVAKQRPSFPDIERDCEHREITSEAFARNERLMTFVLRLNGSVYKVRVNHGLGVTVLKLRVERDSQGTDHIVNVDGLSAEERHAVFHALTEGLIRLVEKGKDSLWSCTMGHRTSVQALSRLPRYAIRKASQLRSRTSSAEDVQTSGAAVTFDHWDLWPHLFPAPHL